MRHAVLWVDISRLPRFPITRHPVYHTTWKPL